MRECPEQVPAHGLMLQHLVTLCLGSQHLLPCLACSSVRPWLTSCGAARYRGYGNAERFVNFWEDIANPPLPCRPVRRAPTARRTSLGAQNFLVVLLLPARVSLLLACVPHVAKGKGRGAKGEAKVVAELVNFSHLRLVEVVAEWRALRASCSVPGRSPTSPDSSAPS